MTKVNSDSGFWLENTLVDVVSFEHMCFFIAGGLRASEGNLYLSFTLENCLRLCRGSLHVEGRRSELELEQGY